MLAVGNGELGGPVERRVKCAQCGDFHAVRETERGDKWDSETQTWLIGQGEVRLQFYSCGDQSFLLGINNQALPE